MTARPRSVWSLRRDLKDYVCSDGGDLIEIYIDGDPMRPLVVDRKTARLLAKRLNECLDATTAKGARKAVQERSEGEEPIT